MNKLLGRMLGALMASPDAHKGPSLQRRALVRDSRPSSFEAERAAPCLTGQPLAAAAGCCWMLLGGWDWLLGAWSLDDLKGSVTALIYSRALV